MATGAGTTWDTEIEAIYREEAPRLRRIVLLLSGDMGQADDVVHDAFLALHDHWRTLSDRSAAAGYLHVTVVNRVRSVERHRRVVRRHLAASPPVPELAADITVVLADEHRRVVHVVRSLPPRQREAIVLRYWAELSETQIAQAMHISPGTVKSTISRALAALGRTLDEVHDEY